MLWRMATQVHFNQFRVTTGLTAITCLQHTCSTCSTWNTNLGQWQSIAFHSEPVTINVFTRQNRKVLDNWKMQTSETKIHVTMTSENINATLDTTASSKCLESSEICSLPRELTDTNYALAIAITWPVLNVVWNCSPKDFMYTHLQKMWLIVSFPSTERTVNVIFNTHVH